MPLTVDALGLRDLDTWTYPLRIIKSFWKVELSMDAQTPIMISHPTIPKNGFECWQTLVEAWSRQLRLELNKIAVRTPPFSQSPMYSSHSPACASEINGNHFRTYQSYILQNSHLHWWVPSLLRILFKWLITEIRIFCFQTNSMYNVRPGHI